LRTSCHRPVASILSAGVRAGVTAGAMLAGTTLGACHGRAPGDFRTASAAGSVAGSVAETIAPAPAYGEAAPAPGIPTLAPLARQVTPAVVAIQSVFGPDSNEIANQGPGLPPGFGPPGRSPFGAPFGPEERQPTRGLGSGFIVSSDGYVLTNNHVVANAERVTVGLSDRRIFTARVIGHDPSTDVALVKIDASGLPTLPLGDDSTVQVGDAVMAVGNPLGLNFTVTSGIISAKGRSGSLRGLFTPKYAIVDFLQTDAVVNPGNSGGPLVDMAGRVVGINSAIASPTGVYAGYGFAVPISIARIVMDEIRKYGHVRHPILGITVQDVGPADAQAAGLKVIRGVLVGSVTDANSPAAKAGLAPGDVVMALDGHPVDRVSTLQRTLFGMQPGQTVTLDVMRFGTRRTVRVTLGEPAGDAQVASSGGTSRAGTARLGIGVAPVSPEIAAQLQLPSGMTGLLVERVDPVSPAANQLQPGDVITDALGPGRPKPIRTIDDLRDAVDHAPNGIVSLQVYSPQAQGTRVVNIQIGK